MPRGSRVRLRPGGGLSKIGTSERWNRQTRGGVRDSRLDLEPSCGRMAIRSSVDGQSQLEVR